MARAYGLFILLVLCRDAAASAVEGTDGTTEQPETPQKVNALNVEAFQVATKLYNASIDLGRALDLGLKGTNLVKVAERLSKVTIALTEERYLRARMPDEVKTINEVLGAELLHAEISYERAMRLMKSVPGCEVPLTLPIVGFGPSSEPPLVSLRLSAEGILYSFLATEKGVLTTKSRRLYDVPWIPADNLAEEVHVTENRDSSIIGAMAAVSSATARVADFLRAGIADVEDYLCTVSGLEAALRSLKLYKARPPHWLHQLEELEGLGYLHLEGALRNVSRGTVKCHDYLPDASMCVLFKA